MRVVCVGGGPGGLYTAILLKKRHPAHDVVVLERTPPEHTYGWGVTYWACMLDTLRAHDDASATAIERESLRWTDGVAHIRDETTVHHGDAGFSISRRRLLEILADRAVDLGVDLRHGVDVTDPADLPEADIVVAADGVGSRVRQWQADHFAAAVTPGRNHYIWLGTTRALDSFTFAFVPTPAGWIWCYAYGFAPDRSTVIVECAPAVRTGLGLDTADTATGLRRLAEIFARPLDGHPLLSATEPDAPLPWQQFRTLTTARWHHDRTVLLGDAAHTTHYSIGAGTKLALEDAIALADALDHHPTPAAAFTAYERQRRAALRSAQNAARFSARWYENIPRYIDLPPARFFTLLGQRHSPLLPYVPPRAYYRLHQATEQSAALRNLRRWAGRRMTSTLRAPVG